MSIRGIRREIERLKAEVAEREEKKRRSANDDRVREATSDTYRWVTEHTKTYNEHWVEEGRPDPYEPFPKMDPQGPDICEGQDKHQSEADPRRPGRR